MRIHNNSKNVIIINYYFAFVLLIDIVSLKITHIALRVGQVMDLILSYNRDITKDVKKLKMRSIMYE